MTKLSVALLTLTLLAACGGGAGKTAAPAQGPFGPVEGKPDPNRWLGEPSKQASAAGAADSQVIAIEAGAPGDRIAAMLRVPTTDCTLLIARGAESVEDLDLFAYGEDGSVLGTDEAPDRTPTLLVCPPHPPRMYVVARIAAGHGLVAIGAQRVAVAEAAKVGKAMGARNRPGEAEQRLMAWTGLDEKLAEHRRLIGATWQDVRRAAVPLDPRIPTRVSAMVDAGRCLDALIVPAEEVAHLDVSVLDVDGRIVGRASAMGRDRTVILCAPVATPVTLEIRAQSGRGVAAVLLSRTAEGATVDEQSFRFELAPSAELAELREKNAARLDAAGYQRAKVIGTGALQVGRRSSIPLELAGGCNRVDVLGGSPVRGLEAWLWTEDGALMASGRATGHVTLHACTAKTRARLDVEPLSLPGRFAVELRAERDAPALLAAHPLAASRLLAHMTARGLIQGARQAGGVKRVVLSPVQLERVDLLVPVGRCIDLTLALGAGAVGAEIRLVDRKTREELELARGTYATSARACALDRGGSLEATAELRAVTGQTEALVATRMLAPRK